jgi:hypothetical protein
MLSLHRSKILLALVIVILLFTQCDSNSCDGEPAKAKVESNRASTRDPRVWLTFIHESGQSFQLVDITEDSPKTTGPLPSGQYDVRASVTKSTGTQTIRLNDVQIKDCVDYNVFVNAISLSMNINGSPR